MTPGEVGRPEDYDMVQIHEGKYIVYGDPKGVLGAYFKAKVGVISFHLTPAGAWAYATVLNIAGADVRVLPFKAAFGG